MEDSMPEYEYKTIKCAHNYQQFYTSRLASFGWKVQNIQETLDRVVNRSMGFSNSTNNSTFYARTFYPHKSDHSFTSGNQSSYGWSSQIGTSVTDMETSLSITFFRDISIPNRNEMLRLENKWWEAAKQYFARMKREKSSGSANWQEIRDLNVYASMARDTLNMPTIKTVPPPPTAPKTISTPSPIKKPEQENAERVTQKPNTPATATINNFEITHNVFQSEQSGIQIRLSFSIQNRKGCRCRVFGYFFDDQGVGLKDINHRFSTTSGRVCVGTSFTPDYDDALFNDYILFMPYSELDQPDGIHNLQMDVRIYDDIHENFIAHTRTSLFRFSKNGDKMRGESISSFQKPEKEPASLKNKKPASTQREREKINADQTESKQKLPSTEDILSEFVKNAGWDEITKDRKYYLDATKLEMEGKRTQAYKKYKQALDLNPNEPNYWMACANQYAVTGDWENQIAFLEKGLQAIPDDPSLLANKAFVLIKNHNYEEAKIIITKLSAKQDQVSQYQHLYLQGWLFETQQEYKKAIQFYDQADEKMISPNREVLINYNQGRCRELMKKK